MFYNLKGNFTSLGKMEKIKILTKREKMLYYLSKVGGLQKYAIRDVALHRFAICGIGSNLFCDLRLQNEPKNLRNCDLRT
jgi:hypothetical protein